jgi:DNA-binding Xre family transcriptional regulator
MQQTGEENIVERTRSFTTAVWKRYSGDIEKAVSDYVDENYKRLGLRSRYVQEPDEAYLSQLNLHRVIAYDTPGERLDFDAVVIGEIEFFETSHSEAMEGDAQKWFRVSCEVEFCGGFRDFRVKSIDEYNAHDTNLRKALTDTLVPFMYAAELEKNAEAILADVYPEALSEPTKIDVRVFANRLGLKIKEARLSRSGTIFGQMIFNDCKVDYYNFDFRRYDSFDADGGTILVDPEVYFLRTLGSWNNTVIHECVHWKKHRKVFELERLYNEKASRIMCRVAETTQDEQKRSDTDWMEWHANTLAPRILMPRRPFKQKADEILARQKQNGQTNISVENIMNAILELSDFFGVSIQAAKIRMIDIGYAEAIGVFEYVDDRYIPAHSFDSEKIGKNQTFSVSSIELRFQYAVNDDFRRLIDSGNFVYIDAHYCISDPKYVTQNEHGVLEMTEYAVNHIDECCLLFDRSTRPNTEYGAKRYTECALFQNAISPTIVDFNYIHKEHNRGIEARAAAMLAEQNEVKEAAAILEKLPGSFGQSLILLMKWRKMSNELLAEKALLSSKTIQRMRNDAEHTWDIETLVAVCIGLQLPPYISTPLIEKAGLAIKVGEKGITYAHLLSTYYRRTIHEVNEYLHLAGYPPISGTE